MPFLMQEWDLCRGSRGNLTDNLVSAKAPKAVLRTAATIEKIHQGGWHYLPVSQLPCCVSRVALVVYSVTSSAAESWSANCHADASCHAGTE